MDERGRGYSPMRICHNFRDIKLPYCNEMTFEKKKARNATSWEHLIINLIKDVTVRMSEATVGRQKCNMDEETLPS